MMVKLTTTLSLVVSLVLQQHVVVVQAVSEVMEEVSEPVPVFCPMDMKECDDGTMVSRNPFHNCNFDDCPIVIVDCTADTKKCHNHGGFEVTRNPDDNCNFYDCELKCCDTEKMPQFFEGGRCCGATGEWVGSWGDGRTFTCGGITSRGPDYPPPFGKPCPRDDEGCPDDTKTCPDGTTLVRDDETCDFPPCPAVDCTTLRKSPCERAKEHGCRWVYGGRNADGSRKSKCVVEKDTECDDLDRRSNCKRFSHCKWRKNKCGPKCRKPKPETECTEEYAPVTCGGSCEFVNMCNAAAAGYKPGQCKRVCTRNRECDEKKEICYRENPETDGPGICIRKGRFCGGFAGFQCPLGQRCVDQPDDGCSIYKGGADCGGVCIKYGCRKPSKKNTCSANEMNPVMCGRKSCTYKSPCLAKAAGYDPESDCRPYCPRPDPRLQCGPFTFPGFQCGDHGCRYGSKCLATSVGFREDQCKKDCSTVKCATNLQCAPGHEQFLPPDQCCPICKPVEVDRCELMACEAPVCLLGQGTYTPPGECCPRCKPNCALVLCAAPECGPNQEIYTPHGQCCPTCRDRHDCSTVQCRKPVCSDGYEMVMPPDQCCPVCEKKRPPKCAKVACLRPKCRLGQKLVTPDGECCPRCETDCSMVPCAYPLCPDGQTPVVKPGQCCPQCPPVKDICSLVRCAYPICDDGQTPVKKDGQCCHTCPAPRDVKITSLAVEEPQPEDECKDAMCPVFDCGPGYHPVRDPNGCCDVCAPEGCRPDCSNVACEKPKCDDGHVLFTPPHKCCPSCVPELDCSRPCPGVPCKDDEQAVDLPGQCCPVCTKKCFL